MDPKIIVPVLAAVISLGGAIASSILALRGQRRQYFGELRKWGDEVCNTLSKAVHACDLDPAKLGQEKFFMLRHDLLLTLSALIDRGRWFFPNLEQGEHGLDKGLAFQGLRQPALDCIVSTYRTCRRLDWSRHEPNKALREELVSLKKDFVSEVQAYLDPRRRRSQFKAMTTFSASESRRRK